MVLHDNIFALGGGNGLDCFSEVEMLDLDIGRWIPTRSMLQKVKYIATGLWLHSVSMIKYTANQEENFPQLKC